jgi:hypothetical protein
VTAIKVKWPTIRLGEIAEFRNGVNYNKSNFGLGVKVVGVSDFRDYTKPKYAALEQINPEGIVTDRNILRDGDIVFVRSNGNRELIGRSLFIERPPEEVTHSAFTIRLRFTAGNVLPKFFAYYLRKTAIRHALTAYGGGTNISNLNQDILSSLVVSIPPEPTQRKIAAILSTYDELIENNLRRIKILEELALFDILTKPQIDMSETDREKVKSTARGLLSTLKESKLVLDWRKRQQARAEVRVTIEKLLDHGLPRAYTPELFEQKTTAVFQHVYDSYYGAGRSVYAMA